MEREAIITQVGFIINIITALAKQEAKDSSAIENIITTHDKLFWLRLMKAE
ncbi:Fic/DOC family N-terminal domain-containing protein [uncultured Helicobacter sp.]|uniref:Fic/DOC family N-terminal domain-containing protein n=1 Tax=uncultured Helicobacter sp. TaxID=175537 RepID=UPI00374EA18C